MNKSGWYKSSHFCHKWTGVDVMISLGNVSALNGSVQMWYEAVLEVFLLQVNNCGCNTKAFWSLSVKQVKPRQEMMTSFQICSVQLWWPYFYHSIRHVLISVVEQNDPVLHISVSSFSHRHHTCHFHEIYTTHAGHLFHHLAFVSNNCMPVRCFDKC